MGPAWRRRWLDSWPLPALLVWVLAWGLCLGLRQLHQVGWALAVGLPALLGLVLACVPGMASTTWRMGLMAGGFPLSAWMLWSGGSEAPAGLWLLPLAVLLLLYPMRAWRDAPVFPTPLGALARLPRLAPLGAGAVVLDAGCGLGHGLRELHAAYPQAQVRGVEWSRPLVWWCAWRHPWAQVHCGDLWQSDWRSLDLVYLFQRPESMPQAVRKARAELRPGAWLVSLEFRALDEAGAPLTGEQHWTLPGGRPVWVYAMDPAHPRANHYTGAPPT